MRGRPLALRDRYIRRLSVTVHCTSCRYIRSGGNPSRPSVFYLESHLYAFLSDRAEHFYRRVHHAIVPTSTDNTVRECQDDGTCVTSRSPDRFRSVRRRLIFDTRVRAAWPGMSISAWPWRAACSPVANSSTGDEYRTAAS